MTGFIYVCEMEYKDEFYYKIGRALNVAKREAELKVGNPFFNLIAIKETRNYEKVEWEIQQSVKNYHFKGEWYKLNKEQYDKLYKDYEFSIYTDEQRTIELKPIPKTPHYVFSKRDDTAKRLYTYHVFRKRKILKGNKAVYRWYYWFYNESGRQIQKACKGCKNRPEAENYIKTLTPQ